MKKRILVYQCFLIFLAYSCNSDDTIVQEPSKAVGSWVLTELIMSEAIDNNNDSSFSTNLVNELECLFAEYTIKEDGTWTSQGVSLEVTYNNPQNLLMFDCPTIDNKSGFWTLEGDKLTLENNQIWTLNQDKITLEIGNDLPGFRQTTYTKN